MMIDYSSIDSPTIAMSRWGNMINEKKPQLIPGRFDGSVRHCFLIQVFQVVRGGLVCLDSLKQFLSDKLLCLMPLPSEVVYSSKHHPVSFGQGFDADADYCKTQNTFRGLSGPRQSRCMLSNIHPDISRSTRDVL